MAFITDLWLLDVTLVFLSIMVIIYFYTTRKFQYWKKRNVMEISPIPIFGNFADCFFLRKSPGQFIMDMYNQSSGLPYMGFYIMDKPSILIRDPELIKHILVKDFEYFSDKYSKTNIKDRLGWTNLFMLKNPAWKFLRSKLTPFFTSGKLKNMFKLMLIVGNDLDNYLESLSLEGKGKTLDIKDLCAKFTTDLIGITAYGLKANSLNNPNAEFRQKGKNIFDFTRHRSFEILTMFFIPSLVKLIRADFFGKDNCDFLRKVFWENVEHRLKTGVKQNDLIDLLIELKKNYAGQEIGGFKFDGDDLVAQAAVFFTGGFETSSTTLALSLYELSQNTEMQNKLRNDILKAIEENDNKVTYEMVTNLPYLHMIVSETLRKYSVLTFIERVAGKDYVLPGYDLILEKGTPVYISSVGLHYDSKYFPEPNKYDPERFNEENKKNLTPYTYLPFGEGPHMCIGLRLGLLESKYGLVQILRKYEVAPCEKTIIPFRIDPKGFTLTSLGGVHLNMKKLSTHNE